MISPEYFPVKRGMISGAKCPISDVEFTKFDATKSELAELVDQCLKHTSAIMYEQDGDEPKNRPLLDRRNLYASSQQ